MKAIDGIIFDVDGTLWDSVSVCTKAWNRVVVEHSSYPPNVTDEKLRQLFGKPMDQIFDAIFPGMGDEEKKKLAGLCESYENELLEKEPGIPYGDVTGTIKELAKHVPLFIVSNCQKGYIEVCMKMLGLEPFIKDHICFGDRPVSKGENIRFLMEKNGLTSAVYVGDTQTDADACKEAGIPMIYAAYGFGTVDNPYAVIRNFEELTTFLLS